MTNNKQAGNFKAPKRMNSQNKNVKPGKFIPRKITDVTNTIASTQNNLVNDSKRTKNLKARVAEYLNSHGEERETISPNELNRSKDSLSSKNITNANNTINSRVETYTEKSNANVKSTGNIKEIEDAKVYEKPVLSPQLKLAPQRKNYYRGTKIRTATRLEENTKNLDSDTLKIIPLGGLCEIGKNMNVFEYGNDLIIGDCGQMFPDDEQPGIDAIIPDFGYIEKNIEKLRAIFLTHGHEDHIGGLPYLLKTIRKHVPIYTGRIAVQLLITKFEEFGLDDYISDLVVVEPRERVTAGIFDVEFVTVNHSIADSFAIAIRTPYGIVVQSGDWKVDYTPENGDPIDLQRLGELGEEGVLCFINESTNIEREGYTVSEKTVGETFEHEFSKAKGRVFVATFASNTSRVQQIITAAENNNRKVALVGRSMLNVFNAANKLGYIKMKADTLVELEEIAELPAEEVCIISTGSQGEPMSALTRMAYAEHKTIEIESGDTVIISATPIPGNERPIFKVINELYKRGANVVYSSISAVHVSGHANREEHKLLFNLLKPKYLIPAHGEYRMLYMQAQLAKTCGIQAENIFILNNGDILECDDESARIAGYTSAVSVLVDGQSTTVNDSHVLLQRSDLASDGIISVAVILDKENNLMAKPTILQYGAILETDSEEMLEYISTFVENYIENNQQNENLINNLRSRKFRNELLNFFRNKTGRKPVTLVSVLELEID